MKIVTVVGARPQFIKAATVSRVLRKDDRIQEILVHTGQHFDPNMSTVFFRDLEIPEPDYHLGIGGGSHGEMTGQQLVNVEKILLGEKPDWVMVYGDTNSTLSGALAAAKLHIPVAHIEAGLRSFNRRMPEEINRVLTDHVSDFLFVPTDTALGNLANEGIVGDKVRLVGDVMYDAAKHYSGKAEKQSEILKDLALEPGDYVLTTIHRAESTDDVQRLRAIFEALDHVSREIPVVLPLHPRTRQALDQAGILDNARRILRLIDPVGYLDMVMLEKSARLIVTDSGGVQKEAFFHGVPCITLRTETEWVELVELGWNQLVTPDDPEAIAETIRLSMDSRGNTGSPYGNGDAAYLIASCFSAYA